MKEAEGGAGKAVEKWLTKLGLKKYSGFSHFAVLRGSFLRLRYGTASQVLDPVKKSV